jgi:hypothetical protein
MLVMELEIERHADDDQLERYSMQTMKAKESAEFEEHLLVCESCQERFMEVDAYVESIRRVAVCMMNSAVSCAGP